MDGLRLSGDDFSGWADEQGMMNSGDDSLARRASWLW